MNMRQMRWVLLMWLSSFLVVPAASAEGWYFGVKTGPMVMKSTATLDMDSNPTNVAGLIGYDVGVGLGDIGIEGELSKTVSQGQTNDPFNAEDVSVDTAALYAAFRTAGPFYFKARAGYVSRDIETGSVTTSKSGMSYGAGLGFGIGIVQLELEYTQMEKDVGFVSLGVQF